MTPLTYRPFFFSLLAAGQDPSFWPFRLMLCAYPLVALFISISLPSAAPSERH